MINFSSASITCGRREKARHSHKREFECLPDGELEDIAVQLYNGSERLTRSYEIALADFNHPYFRGLGAFDALAERKGHEYALQALGIPVPEPRESFISRIKNYFLN